MYRVINYNNNPSGIYDSTKNLYMPVDPNNTDYARFKKQINEDRAELQDAEGNTLTATQAKAFVATLP